MRRTLKLFDSMTKSEKPLEPKCGDTYLMYTCGPTVYNFAHIGNFRTFLFEDLLRRVLLLFGYKVRQVMNLTDVDDKTIKGAKEQNLSLKEYTKRYADAFFEDRKALRMQEVEEYPRATEFIPQMIEMIQTLMDKGHAYKGSDGSVYFSIGSFPTYGRLSHLPLEALKKGASGKNVGDDYDKDSVHDFVLWKAYEKERDGEVFWESPWGKGRPGWHIECSVMAKALLGPTIDLHAGGVDLIFPHHENEVAQSEGASGQLFSCHWAHADHLMVDGKKMSKRFNNFYTLRDLLEKGYLPSAIRLYLLSTHYRMPMNFTLTGLQASFTAMKRLRDTYEKLREWTPKKEEGSTEWLKMALEKFEEALSRDLAISEALSHVFEIAHSINTAIDKGELSKQEKEEALRVFMVFDSILDILRPDEEKLPENVEKLIKEREEARGTKNWKESDRIRALLKEQGYLVEDTPKGPKVTKELNK